FDDLLIGQPRFTNGQDREGRILLYLGSATGLGATSSGEFESDLAFAQVGSVRGLAAVGDVDNDGIEDFAAGASFAPVSEDPSPGNFFLGSAEGRVYFFEGTTATDASGDPDFAAPQTIDGAPGEYFGGTISAAGDVDCDGFGDVLVAGPLPFSSATFTFGAGKVTLLYGSATGLSTDAADKWEYEPDTGTNVNVGLSLAPVGNPTNITSGGNSCDGFAIGVPNDDTGGVTDRGRVDVFFGSATRFDATTSPDIVLLGAAQENSFGASMAGGFSIDGDAIPDLAIASTGDDTGGVDRGSVKIFSGNATTGFGTTPSITFNGVRSNENFGTSVAFAGDLNNDGRQDIVVGAENSTNTVNDEGAAYVFQQGPTGFLSTADWETFSGETGSRYGIFVGAGDFDNDGFSSVLIAASERDVGGAADAGDVRVYEGREDCFIDGAFYDDQDPHPDGGGCSRCDVATSRTTWTAVLAVGAACTNNDLCTTGTTCQADGSCSMGTAVSCDDGNECTTDGVCDSDTGCPAKVNVADDTPCTDDGLSCTDDVCQAGACVNELQADTCLIAGTCFDNGDDNPANSCEACTSATSTSAFTSKADGTACTDDGLSCTDDVCQAGACVNELQAGNCLVAGACVADGADNPANECESCIAATDTTAFTPKSSGTACDDGAFCTVMDACDGAGACAGMTRDCSGLTNDCNTGTCDDAADSCVASPLADGTACTSDNIACTDDVCRAGACQNELQAGNCLIDGGCFADGVDNPMNQCEACVAASAPSAFTPKAAGVACDDGAFCTDADTCDGVGACDPGPARDCSGLDDACNTGTCDDTADACVASPLPDTTVCLSAGCNMNGNFQPESTCDGVGACAQEPVVDCGLYFCDDTLPSTTDRCLTECMNDMECRESFDAMSVRQIVCDVPNVTCIATTNIAPIAEAGEDVQAAAESVVTLDGSNSSDPNGDTLTFAWAFTACDDGSLVEDLMPTGPNAPQATATLPRAAIGTVCTFELTVTDDGDPQEVGTDTVNITINALDNGAPEAVATADPDMMVMQGNTVTLDSAGSSDPDGDELTFAWSWIDDAADSPAMEFAPMPTEGDMATLEVAIPTNLVQDEVYTFELTVTDAFGASDTAEVRVEVAGPQVMEPEPDMGTGMEPEPDMGMEPEPDMGTVPEPDMGMEPPEGELRGSSCLCTSVDRPKDGEPSNVWLLGLLVALVGFGRERARARRD
ncbi:MAG: PKD domain-containing protein, partial [Myxococcota bacterium]